MPFGIAPLLGAISPSNLKKNVSGILGRPYGFEGCLPSRPQPILRLRLRCWALVRQVFS